MNIEIENDIKSDIMFYMSKTDKLKEKLVRGSIDAHELKTLLGKCGFRQRRQSGSHETWSDGVNVMTLAVHGKDLKPYQVKEAQRILIGAKNEKK